MIQRYTHYVDGAGNIEGDPFALGDWVKFSDHQEIVGELLEALNNICDSLRKREGSKLITVNHDELAALIPIARAAIAKAEGREL